MKFKEEIVMHRIIKDLTQAYLISGDLNANIGKNKNRYHRDFIDSKIDSEELSNDWHKLGDDLNKAMNKYDQRVLMYDGRQ